MKDIGFDTWLLLCAIAAWFSAYSFDCGNVEGQDIPEPPIVSAPNIYFDAFRVRISEADFRLECTDRIRSQWYPRGCVRDGAAILQRHYAVARRRGRTLHEELRAYSRRATGQVPPRSPRGAWVSGLQWDLSSEPIGWPPHIPWDRYLDRAIQIREAMESYVDRALDGWPERPCTEDPDHWGGIDCADDGSVRGACDRVPRSWRLIECGPVVNGFYAVPQTIPAGVARGRGRRK